MSGQRLSVVHRDVSPQNVILSYDGTVKLLDFGVAMSSVTEHAESIIVGKWMYMSPETTMNKQIDHRSDLFSLGVILYLLCSGYMPFSGTEPKAIVKKIRAGQYKPLQQLAPEVPEALAALVDRLLAPNPNDRPERGQEVVAELTEIMRYHGLESSAPHIASLLARLFPPEGSRPSDSGPTELVRTSSSMMVPRTTTTGRGMAVDVSVTLTPNRHDLSATPRGHESLSPTPRGHESLSPTPTGLSQVATSIAHTTTQGATTVSTTRASTVPRANALPVRTKVRPTVSPPGGSSLKILMFVALMIGVGIGLFLLIRPT
jgi:serine/threonine-protein kinase